MGNERGREENERGTDEARKVRAKSDEPQSVDLGERSFAGENIAAAERSHGQSRRESALSADNRSLGSHAQENSAGLTKSDGRVAPQDDVTTEDPTGTARRRERDRS